MFKKLYHRIRLLTIRDKESYYYLYKIIGYIPKNLQLYEQAFVHKSSAIETENGLCQNNERLEFLGDAILDAVITDIIYKRYPDKREGFLTNARSKIVSRETLNRVADELGLAKKIVTSTKTNTHNNCILGNALEALIGAIYLDLGYAKCFKFIEKTLVSKHINIDSLVQKEVNFKSNLIEWGQKNKEMLEFRVLESFCDNNGYLVFQTGIFLAGKEIGIGIGYSKKESQQHAAQMALNKLQTDKELKAFIAERKSKQPKKKQTEQQTVET